MTRRGSIAAAAAIELRDKHGFNPDVVFGTPGWGETLFLKRCGPPRATCFTPNSSLPHERAHLGFDPEFTPASVNERVALTAELGYLLLAIYGADKMLAPTAWQARSFPEDVQKRITVIHDGIDTGKVRPDPAARVKLPGTEREFSAGDEVLTFINRNLEPHRGFHIFMRALPAVLKPAPRRTSSLSAATASATAARRRPARHGAK